MASNFDSTDHNVKTAQALLAEDHLPFHRKITYGFTDMAGNLLYCIVGSYMLYFFTNVFGLSVGTAGSLLLLGRVIDAFGAPIMGVLVDHTHSKYGKSRPWFLWMSLPFAIFIWLLFTTPSFGMTGKIIWAGAMYIFAELTYTAMSTPITSVLPNLTSDSDDRMSANSIRLVLGNVGNFLAVTFVIPLAGVLGGGNDQKGWSLAVGIYSIVGFILLIIGFLDMREKNIEQEEIITIKESFKAAKGNWPWLIIVGANLILWTAYSARNAALPYYFQYNLDDKGLISFFNGFSIIQIVGMASVPFFAKFLHKWGTTVLTLAITMVGQVIIGIAGDNITLALAGWILACIGSGSAMTMFFGMVGDTVDFGEWKNGIRANGFLTAMGASFCIQMGSGIGSFFAAKIMAAFGFSAAKAVQSTGSLNAISFTFIWLPVIIYTFSLILMIIYRKWEKHEPIVNEELAERHAAAESR
ncbi:transporter, major facilitator family protein [Paucilactobacillus oligofermentans DSM 15707 = LMG 22743]|uniref:Transporter, major facilitator family protein n=1 Tax=Paucilactobacillus oligofermentans DSM 15707 = LMG 22743 TaxID=1423778 RepID=A0A0R1RMY9_9LACO|nr:MFS transporter [Paucilactobacillus oligofermentans]KRL55445.1 transporter, major facilitator family protein [Paucilactobacillus oligofermentans DSM 15707 = LMG 22743]CUS25570.1 Putative xylose-proton symporter [Paucilactobacillus oligofermentans DSM 15707 = LMG 22743]